MATLPRHDATMKPKPQPIRGTLVGATDRQLEALDALILCQNQRDAAEQLGIGARRYRHIMFDLREQTGLTTAQLMVVRDRDKRKAA